MSDVGLADRQILIDWTRVEDLEVDDAQTRTFEYHVVKDWSAERVLLTIKCFNAEAETVRLDPTVISNAADPDSYPEIANRRVRHLYTTGRI